MSCRCIVRISATDWTEGGWNADESVQLAAMLKTRGVDLIDCSTGGNVPKAPIPVGPGYQVQFAERIRAEAGILTGAVGLITTACRGRGHSGQRPGRPGAAGPRVSARAVLPAAGGARTGRRNGLAGAVRAGQAAGSGGRRAAVSQLLSF